MIKKKGCNLIYLYFALFLFLNEVNVAFKFFYNNFYRNHIFNCTVKLMINERKNYILIYYESKF